MDEGAQRRRPTEKFIQEEVMHLFITTYGRPNKMATWGALTPSLQRRTTIVVQHRERNKYDDYAYHDILVLPPGITRLSPTRQFILENASQLYGSRYICMMDDDILSFGWRDNPNEIKLSVATPVQINRMFSRCHLWLQNGLAHCGISPRGMNHTVDDNVKLNGRLCQLLCYDTKIVAENNFRMDRVSLMQDFDMTLQMLRAGYANKVLFQGCTNTRGSGGVGGCNSYRTPDMQSATARKLKKLHPEFVSLRQKQSGQYKDQMITDVTVQWKKAYASSQE